jgi:hypothetical protein
MQTLRGTIQPVMVVFALGLGACSHAVSLEDRADGPNLDGADSARPSSDGAPAAAGTLAICQATCERLPKECLDPECIAHCSALVDDPRCGIWARPLVACQARSRPGDNVCINGRSTLKETVCAMETRMWAACYVSGVGAAPVTPAQGGQSP